MNKAAFYGRPAEIREDKALIINNLEISSTKKLSGCIKVALYVVIAALELWE